MKAIIEQIERKKESGCAGGLDSYELSKNKKELIVMLKNNNVIKVEKTYNKNYLISIYGDNKYSILQYFKEYTKQYARYMIEQLIY